MEKTPTDLSSQSGAESVGATLRAAREVQGLTIENLADRIKFSVRQLEALEGNKFELLPQGAFLRGFVRSYARALQLDEVALIALLSPVQLASNEMADAQAAASVSFSSTPSAVTKNAYVLGAAALLAILLGLFLWSQPSDRAPAKVSLEEVTLPALESASAVVAASSQVAAASAVEEVKTVIASPVTPMPAPNVPLKPAESVVPPAPKLPSTVVANSPKASAPVVVAAPIATDDAALARLKMRPIHIVFIQDSWMEIVDVNGEMLLSRMNAAGAEKWIGGRGRAPYQVSIGKVDAVKIYYRGREVNLSQYKRGEVAHLVLE